MILSVPLNKLIKREKKQNKKEIKKTDRSSDVTQPIRFSVSPQKSIDSGFSL